MSGKPKPSHAPAVILGPCRCQGCGEEVVYLYDGRRMLGWQHGTGRLRCPSVSMFPGVSRRKYKRLWMRQWRLREAERAVSCP